MYSIKLKHGHAMSFGKDFEMIDTVYCELRWENEDGKDEYVTSTRGYRWTKKTAKAADDAAKRQGIALKAEHGAYLRKHGERKEVVEARKKKIEREEFERNRQIGQRCSRKRHEIIAALRSGGDPALADHLEKGEELVQTT